MLFTKTLNILKQNLYPKRYWKVYPTLVYDHTIISTPSKSSKYYIEISNQLGEIILTKECKGKNKIDFTTWEKGVYQMLIKHKNGELKSKILVYPQP